MTEQMETTWKELLAHESEKAYFAELTRFVEQERTIGAVYPTPENIFRAFESCPFEKVSVVILGQDPYHGEGQANGLAFSVDADAKLPPSLKNIFKEIQDDIGSTSEVRTSGDLSYLAEQGVLLLNSTLTVRAGEPGSHQGKGWEEFTDAIIHKLSEKRKNLVFILWGNYAKTKGADIDRTKHLVLEAPHPSPFSAYTGFFGSKHFSQANTYLVAHGNTSIRWY